MVDLLGIGTMVGAGLNAAANIAMNERNAELQRDLLDKQQGFTRDERVSSQLYQTAEREAAQQYNLNMWNLNNEYNSPAAQAERLSVAGINPASVLGSNGSVVASSPVQTSPQSGVQGEVVTAPQPAQQFNIGAGINDTIRALSEAALNSENAETVKETRDSLVEGLEQDVEYKKQQNALTKTFGYLERSAALKKTKEEANLALKQSIKFEKDANYTEALIETEKAHKIMMDALGRKTGYEADIAKQELDNWLEYRQAELRKMYADIDYTRNKDNREQLSNEVEVIKGWNQLDLLHADKELALAKKDEAVAMAEKIMREAEMMPTGPDAYLWRKNLLQQLEEDLKSKQFDNTWLARFSKYLSGPSSNVGSAALMLAKFLK